MNDAKMLMRNSQLQSPLTEECVYSEEMPDFCQIHMSHLLICQALVLAKSVYGWKAEEKIAQ